MTINFPLWVKTTKCHTRTKRVVFRGGRHGAVAIEFRRPANVPDLRNAS